MWLIIILAVLFTTLLLLAIYQQLQNLPQPQLIMQEIIQQPVMQPDQERYQIQGLNSELVLHCKKSSRCNLHHSPKTSMENVRIADSTNEYNIFVSAVQESSKCLYADSLLVHGRLPKAQTRNSSEEVIRLQGCIIFFPVEGNEISSTV